MTVVMPNGGATRPTFIDVHDRHKTRGRTTWGVFSERSYRSNRTGTTGTFDSASVRSADVSGRSTFEVSSRRVTEGRGLHYQRRTEGRNTRATSPSREREALGWVSLPRRVSLKLTARWRGRKQTVGPTPFAPPQRRWSSFARALNRTQVRLR